MSVLDLIVLAFTKASEEHKYLKSEWPRIIQKFDVLMPNPTTFLYSMYGLSNLDMVIRSMEKDCKSFSGRERKLSIEEIPKVNHLWWLSRLWICDAYELIRLIDEMNYIYKLQAEDFISLKKDLKLLRIPLAKSQIANDRNYDKPIIQTKYIPDKKIAEGYFYKKHTPTQVFNMDVSLSERGSIVWQTIDLNDEHFRQFERLKLSERLFCMLSLARVRQST